MADLWIIPSVGGTVHFAERDALKGALLNTLTAVRPTREATLQISNTENSKQIFPEKELRSHIPNFHIHVSVSDLYIPTMDLPILLQEICGQILGIYKSLTDT
jgi:hypothetical protein